MLVDGLYCAMLEVGYSARRNKIPGPLARIMIDTAHESLEAWLRDENAAFRFARLLLSGPTNLHTTTGQLPEPTRTACLRLVRLLEYMASLHDGRAPKVQATAII